MISVVVIDDTLGFLRGPWALSRLIEDDRSARCGRFTGAADVTVPAGGGPARWVESGVLRFGDHEGPAERQLLLVPGPGSAVAVLFADGRHYVDLDLSAGSWHAVHLCGADRYEISTTVRSADLVEEAWAVTGPAKDYRAHTTLVRARP